MSQLLVCESKGVEVNVEKNTVIGVDPLTSSAYSEKYQPEMDGGTPLERTGSADTT